MDEGGNKWLWIIGALALGAVILSRKKLIDMSDADAITQYLQSKLPSNAAQYAEDIAAGVVGSMPSDFVDPNGGDPKLRWALDVAAVGQYESGFGTYPGYTPAGDPLGWGDAGNAFGFWQLDKHYHNAFITSPDAQDSANTVSAQANYAAGILAGNWASFAGQDPETREYLMYVTYNASLSRIKGLVGQGQTLTQIDATTTQRSGAGYGANVAQLVSSWS